MRLALTFVLLTVLVGCGPFTRDVSTPQLYSLDGVKLLVKDNDESQDPSTFGQASYTVSPDRKLLLRFESLSEHKSSVEVGGGKKVLVQLSLVHAEDATGAVSSLRLCPVTRSWMMLASWHYAHPFGASGKWQAAGGDVDEAGCVKGSLVAGDTPRTLAFDMTQWFIDYPRGRDVNYGFALLSDKPLEVVGETSGSYSPRILFDSLTTVTLDPFKPHTR